MYLGVLFGYFGGIVLLTIVLPVASGLIEGAGLRNGSETLLLIGKWFVFWAVGVRLVLAGLRQITKPSFTADKVFGIREKAALPIVQELGFSNLSIGLLGVLSLVRPDWFVPAALISAVFYGMAGIRHLAGGGRSTTGTIAMASDLFIGLVLAGYLAAGLFRP